MVSEIVIAGLMIWLGLLSLGLIFGRAGALADRRADAMRRHPSVRPVDDFDQHADDAVNLVTADHQEQAHLACWERELRGVK